METMKKLMVLLVVITLIAGCTKNPKTMLENKYGIEFRAYDGGKEFKGNYRFIEDYNQYSTKKEIKNSIDKKMGMVGEPNRYGYEWQTPKIEVMIDSRVVQIILK
jgi:hypothetical protein